MDKKELTSVTQTDMKINKWRGIQKKRINKDITEVIILVDEDIEEESKNSSDKTGNINYVHNVNVVMKNNNEDLNEDAIDYLSNLVPTRDSATYWANRRFVDYYEVLGERISSKLDFGDTPATSHAAISVNHGGGISNPYINNPEFISTVRELPCSSNDCKNSETASAAADVVVHVKTHVNVPNGTRNENVPDVPIIVGNKDIPQYAPVEPDPNFAPHFIQVTVPLMSDLTRVPELQWYPQGNVQNPLEFTKIFRNSWTSNFPIDWSGYTEKRHTRPNQWTNYRQTTNVGLDELLSKWGELFSIEMNKYLHSK
ncbi:hypothetical protein FQR65_LT07490 [Abscondita terminalis]|nr:hypothetical protein FQR65_LT07490 [Abscondita terminalis]